MSNELQMTIFLFIFEGNKAFYKIVFAKNRNIVAKGIDRAVGEIHRIIGNGPIYLSFDLDVLDMAYAPAVADPEAEGLKSRE